MFRHTQVLIAASCFMTMLAGTAGAQLIVMGTLSFAL